MMGSFWLWGGWFFLTLPDRLSCPPFIYMVHFEFEFTVPVPLYHLFLKTKKVSGWLFYYLFPPTTSKKIKGG